MALSNQASAQAPAQKRVLSALERILIEVQKAVRAVSFYPPGHPMLAQIQTKAYEQVAKAASYFGELALEIGRSGITYEGVQLNTGNEALRSLASQLFKRRMKKLIILEGVTPQEFSAFLEAAALDTEEVYLRGGIDTILIQASVSHIWSNQVDFNRLREAEQATEEEEAPPLPEPSAEPEENPFLDSISLEETEEEVELSAEEQRLAEVLPALDRAIDPEQYYELVLLLVEFAEHFLTERRWAPLLRIAETLQRHSSDPARGVELKKYSYRGLRRITTPEVVRAILTALTAEGRTDDEIDSLLNIIGIIGAPAADTLLSRFPYLKVPFHRKLAEQALYRIGPAAAPKLAPLLSSADPQVVAAGVRILAHYRLPESVEQLAELASREEPEIRQARVRALLRIRTAAALDQLYDLVLRGPADVRRQIVDAFGHSREVRAIPLLMNLAASQRELNVESDLRDAVFTALGRIGGEEVAGALMRFATERKLWRPRHDEESIGRALMALGEAITTAGRLAELESLEVKGERLQRVLLKACERARARLSNGGTPDG